MKAREELIKECQSLLADARVYLGENNNVAELVVLEKSKPMIAVGEMRERDRHANDLLDRIGRFLVAMTYLED